MTQGDQYSYEVQVIDEYSLDQLVELGGNGWKVAATLPASNEAGVQLLMTRPGLTFQERVTMDQRRRYFQSWDIDIHQRDRNRSQ